MSIYKKTSLGFKVDNTMLPDPSSYSYTVADLDASAERDTSGLLHRDKVSTKHNVQLKWDALDWETIQSVNALVAAESFTFEFPCPESGGTHSGTYYVGDRSVDNIMLLGSTWKDYIGGLSINFIEF